MSATIEALGAQVTRLATEMVSSGLMDDRGKVGLLTVLRDLRRELAIIDDDLVTQLAATRSNGETIEDIAVVRFGSQRTEWDRDAAYRAIMARAREDACADTANCAVDPDTGERSPTWEQAVAAFEAFYVRGEKGIRVDPLVRPMRDAGHDPSEFRATHGRTVRVEIM